MERVKARNSEQEERRKVSRIEENILIFCKLKDDHKIMEWIAKDISGVGLRFESDRFVPPSTFMEMEIYQPLDYLKSRIVSIYVLAKVVWIKEIEKRKRYRGSNKYFGGVKFTKISKQDRDIILKYVKERIKKKGYSS
ncbi:MAG: PilZ domain-containing protein [Candidatus Lokiarchaeia archaeon]